MIDVKGKTPEDLVNLINSAGTKQDELFEKKRVIEEFRIETTYKEISEVKKDLGDLKSLTFDINNTGPMLRSIESGRQYMNAAGKRLRFVNDDFNGKVPFFQKNLLFFGAYSGDGKSTLTANICFDLVSQGKKVLVISNEELAYDVLNRVTCLGKGWAYTDHEKFTDAQKNILDESAVGLASRMYVVDNDYPGSNGYLTTSYEGVTSILEGIHSQSMKYDAIIIDYYQNISMMKSDPKADIYRTQAKFVKYIDQFKNRYPAPIILMGQLAPLTQENPLPFKQRIEGSKSVFNVATFAAEVRADKKGLRTEWTFHKTRFGECQGQSMYTGWDRGRYVPYDDEFKKKVADYLTRKAQDQYRPKTI